MAGKVVSSKPIRGGGTPRAIALRVQTSVPVLTVVIAKDGECFSAQCPELDLITEMDSPESALDDMLTMIREYAEDYLARVDEFGSSPNRAHHRPHVEAVAACSDAWELREKVSVRFGHVHLPTVS